MHWVSEKRKCLASLLDSSISISGVRDCKYVYSGFPNQNSCLTSWWSVGFVTYYKRNNHTLKYVKKNEYEKYFLFKLCTLKLRGRKGTVCVWLKDGQYFPLSL